MLTGKQRAYLKSLATNLDPAVFIGKSELTENVLEEISDYLNAHEIVKVKIQENAELGCKETANAAAEALGADYVQSIGRKFVLYRRSKEKKINLPK